MMQDRTNPNSYGPRQTDPNQDLAQALQPQMRMDVGPQIYEALETADPETTWLANSIGSTVKRRGMSDLVMKSAFMGETPDELRAYADAEKATNEALRMAKESANMSDQEFQSLLGQLEKETNSQVKPAERPGLEMPNSNQLGLAGLTALFGSKRFAFDALATPANFKLGEQEQGYQDDILREKREWGQRSERLQLLGDKLGFAREDSRFYRNEALRQADKLSEIGIEKARTIAEAARRAYNQGERRLGDARTLEAKAWTAETVQEAELAVNQLISDYQDVKGVQMDPDTVKRIFAGAKLRESQAIYAAQFGATIKREDAIVDDFVNKVRSNYGDTAGISPEAAAQLNQDAAELAASIWPDDEKRQAAMALRMRIDPKSTIAGQRFETIDKPKAEFEGSIRPFEFSKAQSDAAKAAADAAIAQGKAADPTGSKAAKRSKIKDLTNKLEDAKRKTDVAKNTMPAPDSEDFAKAKQKHQELLEEEYQLVVAKRKAAGGEAPNRASYMAERGAGGGFMDKALTRAAGAKPSNKQPTPDKTSSIFNKAAAEAKALIKQYPDKAAAIRKRFREHYGAELR